MNEIDALIDYYRRAYALAPAELESGYHADEKQDDLEELQDKLAELAEGRSVLELACGTGYWTEILAETADAIVATDADPDALALAQTRDLPNTLWLRADARAIPDAALDGAPTMLVAASFWQHVPRDGQDALIRHWRARLGADVLLALIGESYVEDVSASTARTDAQGNTWQFALLPDGSRTEIMVNYPSDSALRKRFAPHARELRIVRLAYYWMLTCRLK